MVLKRVLAAFLQRNAFNGAISCGHVLQTPQATFHGTGCVVDTWGTHLNCSCSSAEPPPSPLRRRKRPKRAGWAKQHIVAAVGGADVAAELLPFTLPS